MLIKKCISRVLYIFVFDELNEGQYPASDNRWTRRDEARNAAGGRGTAALWAAVAATAAVPTADAAEAAGSSIR